MEIETGEVSWQLTNPRGGMIWSGLLLEGEMKCSRRAVILCPWRRMAHGSEFQRDERTIHGLLDWHMRLVPPIFRLEELCCVKLTFLCELCWF
jgi:hypothetical protein